MLLRDLQLPDDGGPRPEPGRATQIARRRQLCCLVRRRLGPVEEVHVALTATDALYSQWQSRIMYYWYKEMRNRPDSDMGGFTRILHSGKPDGLMDEIPTLVVDPLPEGADRGYIVLNRPWAFVQWLKNQTSKKTMYLWLNQITYLKFFPEEKGPVSKIDPIGNSPVIIKKAQLEKIAPTWMNISLNMKDDAETDKAFGWVLEMYAYAVASALHGVHHNLRKDFMIQPPWDLKSEGSFIIHYTYGCDYTLKGELTYGKIGEWRFDKRSYLRSPPPRNLTLPPPGVPESVGQSPGGGGLFLETCIHRRFPPRLRVAANGAAASSRARAPAGYYILLQSKEQGPYPPARITIR
ncbi:hypothetical protein GUJ93_ZPchr0010g9023 [Zizania palustris]|uniref:Hydroxyproline O-arabinosyltransferase-like domain-containing protein n=1 Tax=Zizania palustris TaxID=103762 RepID=A0A8J5W8S1_ZIZPA|nr:hypothetical protein GUJ93_ZPchr0010g9023 [Zizania palustris]